MNIESRPPYKGGVLLCALLLHLLCIFARSYPLFLYQATMGGALARSVSTALPLRQLQINSLSLSRPPPSPLTHTQAQALSQSPQMEL